MALTAAEKQRRYRERKASTTVTLPRAEFEQLQQELAYLRRAAAEASGLPTEPVCAEGPSQPLSYARWLFSIECRVDQILRADNAVGLLDRRYTPVRAAYAQALSESRRAGTFPVFQEDSRA